MRLNVKCVKCMKVFMKVFMKVWPFSCGGKDRIRCCLPSLHNISLCLRHPVIVVASKLLLCPLHVISVLDISIIVWKHKISLIHQLLHQISLSELSPFEWWVSCHFYRPHSREHLRIPHMFSACIS